MKVGKNQITFYDLSCFVPQGGYRFKDSRILLESFEGEVDCWQQQQEA